MRPSIILVMFLALSWQLIVSCESTEKVDNSLPEECCAIYRDSLISWIRSCNKFNRDSYNIGEDTLTITLNQTGMNYIWQELPDESLLSGLGKKCGFNLAFNKSQTGLAYRFDFPLDKTDTSYSIPCDFLLFIFENRIPDEQSK